MLIKEDTLDDLLMAVFKKIITSKTHTNSTAGKAKEIHGVLLELREPRARISRTEGRSTLISSLGETFWYFSNTPKIDHIEYYIPHYREKARIPKEYSDAPGAYGPRLFGGDNGENQVERIIESLKLPNKHDSRQAVVQIFNNEDIEKPDVPCTCTIQFLARGDKL